MHIPTQNPTNPRFSSKTLAKTPHPPTLLSTHLALSLSKKLVPTEEQTDGRMSCIPAFAKDASHHLRLGVVVAMQGPGLGDGPLELVGVDVVDAHGRADAALDERHALLAVAVFDGVRKTLILPRFNPVTQGIGAGGGMVKPRGRATKGTGFGGTACS